MLKKATLPLLVMLLASVGCGEQDPSRSALDSNVNEIVYREAKADQQVVLQGKDALVLRLEAQPSTGYEWIGGPANPAVLRQVKTTEVGPEYECPKPFVPGAACTQILRFIGTRAGTSRIDLELSRPWEANNMPGRQPIKTYSVDVVVKAPFRGTYAPKAAAPQSQPRPGQIEAPGLPVYFDWYDQGIVTSVKDQGSCGSCWAFGAVATVESQIAWKDGVHRDLSEQYLVSCNSDGFGCAGGWWTYDYFISKTGYAYEAGSVYEYDFPYYGYDAGCYPPYPHHEKLNSWAYVDDVSDGQIPYYEHWPSTAQIKQKIYDHGPVGTVVCSNTWGGYYGGIFYSHCSTPTHIVMITGWDDSQGVFYIKNSWGSGWGEGGYMRLPYGYCLVGYQSTYLSYGGGGTNLPPVASANGPYSGLVNSSISFSSAGSNDPDGTIASYSWDFGDGSTSTAANPRHTYTSVGTFTVSLTVTDNLGATGTDTTSATINDGGGNQPPVANANGPYSGAVNSSISFSSAGSNDPDGTITSYSWDFGDGSTSTAANPSHTYTSAGTFTVRLTVTDDQGATGTNTTTATITDGGGYITTEQEPNDGVSNADGPVGRGVAFTGSWGDYNDQDYFYFDVASPTTVDVVVEVTGGSNSSVTWVASHESNPQSWVGWDETGPNVMEGSFDATSTGRYYLIVYTWSSGGTYRATVNW